MAIMMGSETAIPQEVIAKPSRVEWRIRHPRWGATTDTLRLREFFRSAGGESYFRTGGEMRYFNAAAREEILRMRLERAKILMGRNESITPEHVMRLQKAYNSAQQNSEKAEQFSSLSTRGEVKETATQCANSFEIARMTSHPDMKKRLRDNLAAYIQVKRDYKVNVLDGLG